MIKLGKEYAPFRARIRKGGRYTEFSLLQQHRVGEKFWKDGFINVLVNGEYTFHEGDTIVIKEINGANLLSYEGKQYFSIYADIEYKTMYDNMAGENLLNLENDIPEELL